MLSTHRNRLSNLPICMNPSRYQNNKFIVTSLILLMSSLTYLRKSLSLYSALFSLFLLNCENYQTYKRIKEIISIKKYFLGK